MNLTQLSVNNFAVATASADPVPGGGSVSALVGALSASLAQMVARLTCGRKKYAEVEPRMIEIIDTLTPIADSLMASVDRDSEAYNEVMKAFSLPKETDDEKAVRKNAIQAGLRLSATVPLHVAKNIVKFLPLIVEVAQNGNSNAITDAYVASCCARAAILGACANVRINLGSIDDKAFVDDLTREVVDCEERANAIEPHIREILFTKL